MIVSLVKGRSKAVEPLTSANGSAMFGVAISPNSANAILLPNNGNAQSVYVATSGTYDVLVSNQNGAVNSGDYITISSLDGIGMKDDSTQSLVLGKALEGFSSATTVTDSASLVNSSGKTVTVSIAEVPVSIDVARNPELNLAPDLPGFLKHLAQVVTNKPIDAARAYLSLGVLIITVIVVGVMLYSGISSSIISIGRNPLSRTSILKGMAGVALTSLAVFIVGVFAVYLLLKL